jgi:hypothetical protein
MAVFRHAREIAAGLALTLLLGSAPRAAQPAKLAHLGGIDQLKAWFNAGQGHPRAILLLSPT